MSISTVEPDLVTAGDTVQWVKSVSGYAPEDGWSLKYRFLGSAGSFDIDGVDNGDGRWLVRAEPTVTGLWVAGDYAWTYAVEKAPDRFTWPDSGTTTVRPDPAGAVPSPLPDTRSWARRTLEAVEATLERRATKEHETYSIQGRSVTRMSPEELMEWRDKLRAEVKREEDAERASKGLKRQNKIMTRLW